MKLSGDSYIKYILVEANYNNLFMRHYDLICYLLISEYSWHFWKFSKTPLEKAHIYNRKAHFADVIISNIAIFTYFFDIVFTTNATPNVSHEIGDTISWITE